jgi:hypothetical protein
LGTRRRTSVGITLLINLRTIDVYSSMDSNIGSNIASGESFPLPTSPGAMLYRSVAVMAPTGATVQKRVIVKTKTTPLTSKERMDE